VSRIKPRLYHQDPAPAMTKLDPTDCTDSGAGADEDATSTATKHVASDLRKRFFHSYNCHSRNPRSRQIVDTLLPLDTCSDTRSRHRDTSSFL
jgi:hypothetical protein